MDLAVREMGSVVAKKASVGSVFEWILLILKELLASFLGFKIPYCRLSSAIPREGAKRPSRNAVLSGESLDLAIG